MELVYCSYLRDRETCLWVLIKAAGKCFWSEPRLYAYLSQHPKGIDFILRILTDKSEGC